MPELHLKQPGLTYTTCGLFTKYCERIQQFRETGYLKNLYRNELDKARFPHDAAYFDSKDLAKKTISDKILKYRAYEIGINRNYDGYQRALAIAVYTFFDQKTGSRISVSEQLGEELHQSVIKKFKRQKVYERFKDKIWAADLTKM